MKTKYSFMQRGAKTILLSLSISTLLTAAPAIWAQSASDLMEQGVYSEETKGDLTGAVQLYQKVIAQAKEDRELAARAQYHLGVCFYKQNDFTDADTAFCAVVKDYSDQKDIAALARKYLAAAHPLQPVPWTDGEVLVGDVDLAGGLKIGMMEYRVDAGTTRSGQKIWRFTSHTTAGGIQSVSHVEVDADSMAPIHSVWKHTLLGKKETRYYPDHADITTVGKDETNTLRFENPVIDNEEAVEWMRRLTFTNGFSVDQPVLSSLGGAVVPIKWEVSGPEMVAVPAGNFSCYKVTLSIAQTFWVSADTNRYIVKFEGGGAIGLLRSIAHHRPDEIPSYTDSTNGFSLTGPPGWMFSAQDADEKNSSKVEIIDPEGLSISEVDFGPLGDIAKQTLREYINDKLAKAAKMYNDFQIRTNSWRNRTLAGQPGLSVVTDYAQGKNKKTGYGAWSFGRTNGVYFQMITSPEDFGALQPKMDAIIDSYTAP